MARSCLLPFSLFLLLVVLPSCFAQISGQQSMRSGATWKGQDQSEQRHRLRRSLDECQIRNLNAVEPSDRIRSEAGLSEYWDDNDQQFQCAGVTAVRHTIEPRGLFLPTFTNTPQLTYIIQGRGKLGAIFPGCPETFQQRGEAQWEEREQQHGGRWEQRRRGQGQREQQQGQDQHQKVRSFRQGDIIALPAGIAKWIYNDGDSNIVAVTVYDRSNDLNQLDQNFRKFFLAGSPQEGRHQQERRGSRSQERGNWQNIFSGFDQQLLSDAFNTDEELIRNLQNPKDNRGAIIRVREDLRFLDPETEKEEQRRPERQHRGREQGERGSHGWIVNGLEETICSQRLIQNIGDPIQADFYNPRGGRITSLNSQKLPILNYLQLSAERGVLYRNSIKAPLYNINANSVIYITRGNSRVQIAGEKGEAVFDGQVQEGQMLVVPQNFVILKQAGDQGCEWVEFKTNDNAMVSPLAGRLSVFRGIPEEVLANSYGISREDARRLKFNREEALVFGQGSSRQLGGGYRGREEDEA